MAVQILTTIAFLLCVNSAVSFVNISNIESSNLHLKGYSISCTGDKFEFTCGDDSNSCTYTVFECDGIIDCPNGADENATNCDAIWANLCLDESKGKPYKVANCSNSMCISECDLCDGYYLDCIDGSDENPVLCSGDDRPQPSAGSCEDYRKSYPIPIPTTPVPTEPTGT